MEYTDIWQPLLLIFVSFSIGLVFGALFTFWRMRIDNELLKIDSEINKENLIKCESNLEIYENKYVNDDYEAY